MKYLKTYNETVWTSGKITGPRSIWAEQVLSTLEDVGIVITDKEWHEPSRAPYGMSYEMSKNRLSLTIQCGSSDSTLSNVMDGLYSFMDHAKSFNVGILKCRVHFIGSLDDDNPEERTPLVYDLFEADSKTEKQLIDAHKNGYVTKIEFTLKKFDDYSEYNKGFIRKYRSYFS